ncbi:MAG: hypothetical protein WC455_16195 [Dehalococcoidia bacterium]|jgi:hypothetical protein
MSDYQKQAQEFLTKTGTKFTAEYLRTGKYFDDDKTERDIYTITLERGSRKFSFTFGQSIMHSGRFVVYDNPERGMSNGVESIQHKGVFRQPADDYPGQRKWGKNKNFAAPTAYDVLSCITKYDPGTFENFCGEFGYDTDSRKAEKVYMGVKNEFQNVAMLFNDKEIEELAEIQ